MKTPTTLEKFADELRVFAFDFSRQPEQFDGADIASATVEVITVDGAPTPLDELVVDNVQVDETYVKAEYSAGIQGRTYLIKCLATTSLGAIMEAFGNLHVVDTSEY